MVAYYNEFEPYAAQWLRNLIKKGYIADGEVDERSITEVQPDDLKGFTQCHFFAGIGGWSLAARLAGWPDDRPLWTGSAPCQPFSASGLRKGKSDERHLWPEFFRLISESRPTVVFGEQVSGAVGDGWLCELSTDMEEIDYETASIVFKGSLLGADHERERLYWVCDSMRKGWNRLSEERNSFAGIYKEKSTISCNQFSYARRSPTEHKQHILQRDGVSLGMERSFLKGYGNAIIPQAASLFIKAYMDTRP